MGADMSGEPNDLQHYDVSKIPFYPPSVSEDCGNGWWRFTWEVNTLPKTPPSSLHLPLPQAARFEEIPQSLVIAILPREPGHITVELLCLHRFLQGPDAGYISLVM